MGGIKQFEVHPERREGGGSISARNNENGLRIKQGLSARNNENGLRIKQGLSARNNENGLRIKQGLSARNNENGLRTLSLTFKVQCTNSFNLLRATDISKLNKETPSKVKYQARYQARQSTFLYHM